MLGGSFGLKLDCTGHAGAIALVVGTDRSLTGSPTVAGELLIDVVAGRRLFLLSAVHGGDAVRFLQTVPLDPALYDLTVHIQGLCGGAPGAQLSNALDFIVGR